MPERRDDVLLGSLDRQEKQRHERYAHLHECVEVVKEKVAELHGKVDDLHDRVSENAVVLIQVRNTLTAFNVMAAVAKWVTAIGGGVAVVVVFVKFVLRM